MTILGGFAAPAPVNIYQNSVRFFLLVANENKARP